MPPAGTEGGGLFRGIPSRPSPDFTALCDFCEHHGGAVKAALPWLAAEVSRNDGHATMLHLVQRWSGTRLYVPKDYGRLVEKTGCELGPATHLCLLEEVGAGSQVEVPSAWGVFMALRRVAINEAVRAEIPRGEIAYRFGVTMRSLRTPR